MPNELELGMSADVQVIENNGEYVDFMNAMNYDEYHIALDQIEGRSLLSTKMCGVLHRVRPNSYIYT